MFHVLNKFPSAFFVNGFVCVTVNFKEQAFLDVVSWNKPSEASAKPPNKSELNSTYLEANRKLELQPGDVVVLGDRRFKFETE